MAPTPGSAAVAPDPDYFNELAKSGISTSGWKTDFSRHTVPYAEIISGGVPRDGIPPIDSPSFVSIEAANSWLADREPVIALEINGDARAYPLQIMTWHEIVNDSVGGIPVAVTFCPLCNSAIAFNRRIGEIVYDFGVSGKLRNSDLIMWDRQTESWWQQFTGEAIVGSLAGIRLDMLPAVIISWGDFRSAYPEGQVLSRETGFSRPYGRNPYAGYDDVDNSRFCFVATLTDACYLWKGWLPSQLTMHRLPFHFRYWRRKRLSVTSMGIKTWWCSSSRGRPLLLTKALLRPE
jgi:hypothetical protein